MTPLNFIITIDVESEKFVRDGVLHHAHYHRDIEQPVRRLLNELKRRKLTAVFFLPLSELYQDFPQVLDVARGMIARGHQLGIHLHIPVNRLSLDETADYIRREIKLFEELLDYAPVSARVGGFNTGKKNTWFKACEACGIVCDSSVVAGADTLTTKHWSDTALRRETRRWGENSYYFDFKDAPLTGIYPMDNGNPTRIGKSPLLQYPVTVLNHDNTNLRMFDLQNTNEDFFYRFIDRFRLVAESGQHTSPIFITTFAHSLGNFSQDGPTAAMNRFEENLDRISRLIQLGEASNSGFMDMASAVSVLYNHEEHEGLEGEKKNRGENKTAVWEEDISLALTGKLKKIFRDGQRLLVLRSAPVPVAKQFLRILRSLDMGLYIDLLVQENSVPVFKDLIVPGALIEYPGTFFNTKTLTSLLERYRASTRYDHVLFIYNNHGLTGYSQIENALLRSGMSCFAVRKDFDGLIHVSKPGVIAAKNRRLMQRRRKERKRQLKTFGFKNIVGFYYFLKLIVYLPVNLITAVFLRAVNRKYVSASITLPPDATSIDFSFVENQIDCNRSQIIDRANRLLSGQIDILGYKDLKYKKKRLMWHTDFVSDFTWPLVPFKQVRYGRRSDKNDIKIPWELSRFHHLVHIALAYRSFLSSEPQTASRYLREIETQWHQWLVSNPPGQGVNWVCPMEVGIRAINWLYLLNLLSPAPGSRLCSTIKKSLRKHGDFIFQHLEYSPRGRGNHYMSNIVALVYLGVFFQYKKHGQQWLSFAIPEFINEIHNQFNADGTSDEGSTRYHCLQTELIRLAVNLLKKNRLDHYIPQWVKDKIKKIEMFYNDLPFHGHIPLLGDNDSGSILPAGTVLSPIFPGENSNNKSTAYPDGGFFIMRSPESYCIIRCGKIGYRGVGVHDHCDQLSFELYRGNDKIIVDPGSYVYTPDYDQRNQFRSTNAHNTLQIGDWEQNRFDPDRLFIMEDDTGAQYLNWKTGDLIDYFSGRHRGYHRYCPGLFHQRDIYLLKEKNTWLIYDQLTGADLESSQTIYLYFNLALGTEPKLDAPILSTKDLGIDLESMPHVSSLPIHQKAFKPVAIQSKNRPLAHMFFLTGDQIEISTQDTQYAPNYGTLQAIKKLTVRCKAPLSHYLTIIKCP